MVTSSKDNLQAHRFINRRVRAALLDGNADGERPLSRLGVGTYAGIFVSVALLAVAGIVGVLRPGGSRAWSEPGAFIVESETGGRYVFLDGVLHPVLNYASGKLLLGEQLHVVSVSVRSLESAPHGPPVGIASAPDSVPDAAHMAGSTWSVCAGGDASDGGRFHTAVFPGRAADGSAVPNGQGYLLRGADGGTVLVAQGHAYSIADRWLAALGYGGASAIEVANDFLASLPPGEPIAPLPIAGLGEPGRPLPGSSDPIAVGTVFVDRLDAHYVMTRAGLTSLTPLQADLLLANPELASAYAGGAPTALPISQARITEAAPPAAPRLGPGAAAPVTAPTLARLPQGDQQLCVRYPADGPPDIVVGESDPSNLTSIGLVQLSTGGGALVTVRSETETGAVASGQAAPLSSRAPAASPPTAAAGSTTIPDAGESFGCDSPMGVPDPGRGSANTGADLVDASAELPNVSTSAPAPDSVVPAARGGDSNPISRTPADSTPGARTPADSTPGATTPAATTPAATTPAATTPVATTPADSTPGASTPSASRSAPARAAANSGSSPGPIICLVTDTGQRYPLAGARALQQLGLSGVNVAQLPAAVIGMLPIGPVLDPAAAAAAPP